MTGESPPSCSRAMIRAAAFVIVGIVPFTAPWGSQRRIDSPIFVYLTGPIVYNHMPSRRTLAGEQDCRNDGSCGSPADGLLGNAGAESGASRRVNPGSSR